MADDAHRYQWLGEAVTVTADSAGVDVLAAARQAPTIAYRCPYGRQLESQTRERRCTFVLHVEEACETEMQETVLSRLRAHLATHDHPSAPAGLDLRSHFARGDHWITRDGRILQVAQMDDDHLLATLAMLWRGRVVGYRMDLHASASGLDLDKDWALSLERELFARAQRAEAGEVATWFAQTPTVRALIGQIDARGLRASIGDAALAAALAAAA